MQIKTSLEALLERTTATGYVVLDSMAIVLMEMEIAALETPAPDIATLPKTAADARFLRRCKTVEGIYTRVGR